MEERREATLWPTRDLVGLLYRVLAIDSHSKIQELKQKQGAILNREQGKEEKNGGKEATLKF